MLNIRLLSNYFAFLFINIEEILMEWELLTIGSTIIRVVFIFDFMSLYFIRLVSLVSGRVIIFRTSYIINEIFFGRFIRLVLRFIASMFLLVFSPNIIRLLLGWDGLGVTSYLLVIFYQRNKSYNAGIITALTNRLGDVGLLVSISIILVYGNWRFLLMTRTTMKFSWLLLVIVVISACTKSAQMPFSAWLPAAMAAPTPVSALVHSSTLVTAGVYLLIRINILLVSTNISTVLIVIGAFTIFIAGCAAILEMDIKKVIALSTLSQLGIIIIIIGAGAPVLAYFHLLSHAFFKAILFICAGIIIHNIKDYQDIRKIRISKNFIPIVTSVILIANISLCGLPFLRGFYSKDIILELIIIKGINMLIVLVVLLGTFLTVAYSCRIRFLVALNINKAESCCQINDNDLFILIGIILLFPSSVLGGIKLSWNIFSFNYIVYLPAWLKLSIIICIGTRILFSVIYYLNKKNNNSNLFNWFLSNIWFIPLTFSVKSTTKSLDYAKRFNLIVEISWLEMTLFKKLLIVFDIREISKQIDHLSYGYIIQIFEIMFIFLIFFIILN